MNVYSQEINKINEKNQNLEKKNFELKSDNDKLSNENSKLNYQIQSSEISNKNLQNDVEHLQKINLMLYLAVNFIIIYSLLLFRLFNK